MKRLWTLSVVVHAYVALRLLPGVAASLGVSWAWALGLLLLVSALLIPTSLRRRSGKRSKAQRRRSDTK